ncbi:MAG: ATP-binding protein [bacterium]
MLKTNLKESGEILTEDLVYHSRLGVYAENPDLLEDPINVILRFDDVIEASVYNGEGDLLKKKQKSGIKNYEKELLWNSKAPQEIFEKIIEHQSQEYIENNNILEFWAPVLSGSDYSTEEYVLLGEVKDQEKKEIAGFVGIKISKRMLIKKSQDFLYKGILLGSIIFLIGSMVIYFITRKITKPLNRLTESVKAFGTGSSFTPVPVETRDEIGKLATAFNNMSESLMRREEEKEHLGEQLRHAQKMEAIGTLAGGIAHDFNNILTAIYGYSILLKLKLDEDDPLCHEVENIISAAERAANLTKSLLAYSRKQSIDLRPVNLNELIKDVKKLLTRLITEEIEFRLNLVEKDLVVMVDSGQMEHVLFNLATNARDAMPNGGVLSITSDYVELEQPHVSNNGLGANDKEKTTQYALLTVADSGMGMNNKILEKIFDPFFTTKEVGKGTGLGLSMVYGIIEQHKGFIDVSSEPGKGSKFKIYLPLILKEAEDKKAEKIPIIQGGRETILIAEDDQEVRKLSKYILEEYGYSVIDVINGSEAVRSFKKHQEDVDLLLFDVIMPKKNGNDAYLEIKKIRPDIKVLFISGYDYNIIQKQGGFVEGINFISKPVSPFFLLKKVRETLDA